MKLYKTTARHEAGTVRRYRWTGTQADAKAATKDELVKGASEATWEEEEVPTDKPSLLKWLNENCTGE